ncbi:unnamed protein product, partial [Discosporangium mesarthrocarpum]
GVQGGQGHSSSFFVCLVFLRWLDERRKRGGEVPGGVRGSGCRTAEDGKVLCCPFVVPLERGREKGFGSGEEPQGLPTLSLESSMQVSAKGWLTTLLMLKATSTLVACYPPTVALLTGHYTLFGRHLQRPWGKGGRRKPAVEGFNMDIRGC